MRHIHLHPLGGAAGDMVVACLLDAFPEHRAVALAAARALSGAPCALVSHDDGVLTGARFVVEAPGGAPALEPREHAHGHPVEAGAATHVAHAHETGHAHAAADARDTAHAHGTAHANAEAHGAMGAHAVAYAHPHPAGHLPAPGPAASSQEPAGPADPPGRDVAAGPQTAPGAMPPHDGHRHATPPGHRRWGDIRAALEAATLPPGALEHALGIFGVLAVAEARVHGVAPDAVWFHEVGAADSIADVVAAAVTIAAIGPARWSVAPLPLGGGTVRGAHGVLPVPAPATARLLEGFALHDDGVGGERVTPTGAAILRHLCGPEAGARADSGGILRRSGHGFGTRRLPGISNCLRALVFEPPVPQPPVASQTTIATGIGTAAGSSGTTVPEPAAASPGFVADTAPIAGAGTPTGPAPAPIATSTPSGHAPSGHRELAVISFEVDDQSGEDLALGLDRVRTAEGVHDVLQVPALGKKGRLAVHVQVLARPDRLEDVVALCFTETTTIGLRTHLVQGRALPRRFETTSVDGREVSAKLVRRPDGTHTAKAEADHLRGVPGHAGRARLRRRAEAGALEREGKQKSSFSEEKEAKRL